MDLRRPWLHGGWSEPVNSETSCHHSLVQGFWTINSMGKKFPQWPNHRIYCIQTYVRGFIDEGARDIFHQGQNTSKHQFCWDIYHSNWVGKWSWKNWVIQKWGYPKSPHTHTYPSSHNHRSGACFIYKRNKSWNISTSFERKNFSGDLLPGSLTLRLKYAIPKEQNHLPSIIFQGSTRC